MRTAKHLEWLKAKLTDVTERRGVSLDEHNTSDLHQIMAEE